MERHEQLLLENKAWAKETTEADPNYFLELSKSQRPDFLWIGCSDSRVNPNEITQTQPGEIFIHRNIADLVVHTDMNLLSVLQYAVEVLEIQHVIVCGHYGCGGVQAALTKKSFGLIDKWLRHIKDVYRMHKHEIDAQQTAEERVDSLVEFNVKEQLLNLAKTSIVQYSWKNNKRPYLHGWVYNMRDGVIKPLMELAPNAALPESIYEYDEFIGADHYVSKTGTR